MGPCLLILPSDFHLLHPLHVPSPLGWRHCPIFAHRAQSLSPRALACSSLPLDHRSLKCSPCLRFVQVFSPLTSPFSTVPPHIGPLSEASTAYASLLYLPAQKKLIVFIYLFYFLYSLLNCAFLKDYYLV